MNLSILLLAAVSAFSLDEYSLTQHLPDKLTEDMKPTKALALAAAKGEFESASFSLLSDADLADVDLVPSDLVCGAAKIPASAIDLKVVAVVWKYPIAWMSIKQRRSLDEHALIPCMLVHDEKLIVRDDKTMTNYLRGDYEGGTRYINMSTADCPEGFNDDLHPVRDAKAFVPCALKKGEYKQFWLTVKVPEEATPGDYRGTLAVRTKASGLLTLDLALTVRPFALPLPRTHYDSAKRFIVSMMGGPNLALTLKAGRDLRQAEEKVFNISKALAEHGVYDVCAGSPFTDLSGDDLGVRCATLMQQAGLPLENIFTGEAYTELLGAKDDKGNFMQVEEVDPARYEKDVAAYAKYAQKLIAGYRQVAPQCQVWAFGSDEGSLWTERRQFAYWHELQKAGGKLFVTCTELVAPGAGWIIDGADVSERRGTEIPRLFQPSGARIFTYASPFLAPDQPSYTRWGKGYGFWKDNWDGLVEYVFYAGANRWNETYMVGGTYRQMGIVYPVQDGVVSTLAFEGYREGVDDVRYFTLLRLLAEKAMASSDAATKKLGRDALVWFEKRLMEKDAHKTLRAETAERIVRLQEKVGALPAEKHSTAPKLAADGFAAKCPESDPAKRAAWFRANSRDDLALPELEKAVAAAADTETRVRAKVALADFLLGRLRRPSAEKVLDEALALCDGDKDIKHKVRQEVLRAKFRAVTTPQVYLEEFTSAQIDKAVALYRQTENKKDALPASERARMLLKIVRAYAQSEAPKKAIELADEILEDVSASDAVRCSLGISVARAQARLGETKAALKSLNKAFGFLNGARLDSADARFGFELAQKADDADGVNRYGTIYASSLSKTEQSDIIQMVTDTMARYAKKTSKKGTAPTGGSESLSLSDEGEAIELD